MLKFATDGLYFTKYMMQVTQLTKKTLKKNSTSAPNGALEAKYKKPKPTNPKPFRLRTDVCEICL